MRLTLTKASGRRYTAIGCSFETCAIAMLATLGELDPEQAECAQHALHAFYQELERGTPISRMTVSSNNDELACTITLDENLSRN